MPSFKLAAIQVLKGSKQPLHPNEITQIALENNLIETTGATPEATMGAIIAVDLKKNKENSPFVKVKPGVYTLNPSYKEEEKKLKDEEEIKDEEEKENISSQYVGKAGEHRVVSELLFRGYNASIMNVDEGLDIVATKNDKLFNIQVKTANRNKFDSYPFDVRKLSFDKFSTSNTFYIFILRNEIHVEFIIFPSYEILKNIDSKNILHVKKYKKYRVNIKIRDEKVYLGNLSNDVTFFQNKWDIIN